MKRPTFTLKTMIIAVSLLIMASLSIALYLVQKRFNDEMRETFEAETIELLESLNSTFVFPVSIGDHSSVETIATSVVNSKYIYSIEVRNSLGELIVTQTDSTIKADDGINVISHTIPIVDPRTVTLSPFEKASDKDKSVGTIRVLLTRTKLNKMTTSVMKDNLVIIGICVLLVLTLIMLLGRVFARNFRFANKTLDDIGNDRFEEVDKPSLIDEFNDLNTHLNVIGSRVTDNIAKIRQSDNFKRNIIAMISHDLRTPVNTMVPLIEVMRGIIGTEAPDSIVCDHLEICRDASKLLQSVLDQMVSFREINQDELIIRSIHFDPERLFDGAYNLYKSKIPGIIKFKVIGECSKPVDLVSQCLIADEGKILRVLCNLIDNACKYTKNGSIDVRWHVAQIDERCELIFSVVDTGCGIDEKSIHYIFDPYFRADGTRPGWGIGLNVVKQFLDVMGGSIYVDSEVGKGTEMRVHVPVSIAKEAGTIDSAVKECSIVIVDDNQNNCYVMEHVLKSMAIPAKSFSNPELALEEIQDLEVDLIFVDYAMPEMTGVQFAKRLRSTGINLPVICVTAHIEESILNEINRSIELDEGLTHVMLKPINVEELRSTVTSILNVKKLVESVLENSSKS